MSLAEAFAKQAVANESLGSPFTARVLTILGGMSDHPGAVFNRMRGWEGDVSYAGHSLPLRLLGGLHALVLSGRAPTLAAHYPPNPAPDGADLATALARTIEVQEDALLDALTSAPQTNEVRRAAVLIAVGHLLTARHGLPIALSELGASAGLNLMWDRFALNTPFGTYGPEDAALTLAPDWTGPCPPRAAPRVVDRRGVDLYPMDPRDPADRLRLLSYLWADQPDRIARTEAAIAAFDATVDRGDAAQWLADRLAAGPAKAALHLVYHTVAWQYFPETTKATCRTTLETAGQKATPESPLARLGIEVDDRPGDGAAITLTTWTGGAGVTEELGRVDFHGRWLRWQLDAD
nr:DUF2332 family protein [uncultured Maritimibacter sp.]